MNSSLGYVHLMHAWSSCVAWQPQVPAHKFVFPCPQRSRPRTCTTCNMHTRQWNVLSAQPVAYPSAQHCQKHLVHTDCSQQRPIWRRTACSNTDATNCIHNPETISHVPSIRPVTHYDTPSTSHQPARATTANRRTAIGMVALSAALLTSPFTPSPAHASKLPVFADNIWEAMGGGPSDLTFPELFLGVWDVESVLTQVELPLGEEVVPDLEVVRRAKTDDLNTSVKYQVAFIRNPRDNRVIFDRAFNTASLLSYYYGKPTNDFIDRIQWNSTDPNVLELRMPGGMFIRTRVTRRSQDQPERDRIETSEYLEQVFDASEQSVSSTGGPKVKASQCFTKFKFRDEKVTPRGQPAIVATQVVSDYVTPMSGVSDEVLMSVMGRPVTLYTYKMRFTRTQDGSGSNAAFS